MRPRRENRPGEASDATSADNRSQLPLWLIVIPAVIAAVVFANSWLSGSGSWPDWVYALLVVGALTLVGTTGIQLWRARTKRQ